MAIHASFLDDAVRAHELAEAMVIIDQAAGYLTEAQLNLMLLDAAAFYQKRVSNSGAFNGR